MPYKIVILYGIILYYEKVIHNFHDFTNELYLC